ncbi:MAG: class I SAM-dependent methyltransferase [Elusimicrobiales bacterium]|nr:class I SAM-dependent methyltransferase [Elusimicrobiales bacterium]
MYDWDDFWKGHKASKAETWLMLERDKLLNRCLDALPPGPKNVLEVGCGSANNLRLLQRRRRDVTCYALDNSQEAISRVKADFPNAVLGDCERSPFESGKFDLIYSAGLMEHFPDEKPFLLEMRRLLKDGGVMLTCVPGRYTLWRLHQLLFFCLLSHGYEKSYTHGGLMTLFGTTGYEVLEYTGLDPFSAQGAVMKLLNLSFDPPLKTIPFKSAYTELCVLARRRGGAAGT